MGIVRRESNDVGETSYDHAASGGRHRAAADAHGCTTERRPAITSNTSRRILASTARTARAWSIVRGPGSTTTATAGSTAVFVSIRPAQCGHTPRPLLRLRSVRRL